MRVWEIRQAFGLENLHETTRPDPSPGPGQVLVRVRAVSLNYRDLLTVRGHYNPRQPLPLIPCSDGAGEVVALGAGVDRVAVGDRVTTSFAQKWLDGEPDKSVQRSTLGGPLDGTLAELMVLDQDGIVPAPPHLDHVSASTLPCAALTAWSALFTLGELKPNELVLVQGTGGVSIFALQLAAAAGARVIVTSSSDEKLARARTLGAWETINYVRHEAWDQEVRRLTDGRGVDHVVEVGGAGTLARSVSAVRFGGRIALIGVLSGVSTEINVVPVLMQQIRIQGLLVGSRAGLEAMNDFIARHRIEPVVDEVFDFGETRAAFDRLASARHFGKICIRLP
jgi:NADPH:quinone reductase-like Zn-dependent oxidoreductase